MSGKTHMLSDVAKNRIEANKPTILIYAQNFVGYDRPIQHIIKQLHLEKYNYSDEDFLQMLDAWGKSTNELIFLIVDAINETPEKNVWKNHFIEFVSLIKKYINLAVIISIRDVEKDWLFNDAMNLYISNNMVEIEHKGFEEIEFPVLKKFCEVFGVNIPTFPLLSPIFANPGLLFLFFETLKRNGIKEINELILKPNFIIYEYIKNMNNRFKEWQNIQNHRTYIHNTTNIVAEEIVEHDFIEAIAYETVYPKTVLIHEKILEYLISEGIFLKRTNSLDELFIYFSYQRFGNYFIALYLLPEGLSPENIQKNETIKKLLSNFNDYKMIVEALIIRLNETHKIDIKQIFADLFTDSELNKFRYECLNKSLDIPEVNKNEFIDVFSQDFEEQTMILDNLLQHAINAKSDLNISKNIHQSLLFMQISQRDYHWSGYLHNSYINDGIVKKIIDWAWDKEVSFEINDESLYLYGLTLGWFLTSSNRVLRDSATKALVNIFTNRVNIFYKVLREFESVNDLYVLERLYAVGYGITLRSTNYNGFKELGDYIYQTIFNVEAVVEHILLRDYAKLTVEYINDKLSLNIDLKKVQPPYRSVMPTSYPTNEEIENHRDSLGRGISSIISSMRTESMGSYGDFGRYTFQSNLTNFNLQSIKFQDLSNFAVKVILEEYISDMALFEDVESRLKTHSSSRYDHNIERIGKKYQWMALYKILAIVADNFEIEDSQEWEKFVPYEGTYQTYIRNIDPTTILKNKDEKHNTWALNLNTDFEHSELSDIEWMSNSEKLPTISGLIDLVQNEKEYLILSTSFSVDGNKEKEKYRNLYYHIDAFVIEKNSINDLVEWAKNNNLYGRDTKIPESHHFSKPYLREYPNSKAYDYIDIDYYGQTTWQIINGTPFNILLTSTAYSNEGQSYDKSVNESIEITLPNKWFIEQMKLKQTLNDGEWINPDGQVIFFDPTVKSYCVSQDNENSVLLANKNLLVEFLEKENLTLFWIMWGEKQVMNTDINYNEEDFLGIAEIQSISYWDGSKIIDEPIKIRFEERN